jgi:hypothetical protein
MFQHACPKKSTSNADAVLTASADSEAVLSPDSDLQPNTLPYN